MTSPSKKRIPSYRHYKPKNLGVVRIDGRDHYLGKYGSPESFEAYHRLIADWLAPTPTPAASLQTSSCKAKTLDEVILAYWKFAETYYVRDGSPTKELECMRYAIRPLRLRFGSTFAAEFGPQKLKTLRNHMIESQGLCRTEVNKRVGRVKRIFRWAVSEEIIPPSVIHGLDSVRGLKKGRCSANESAPVRPADEASIEGIRALLPPTLNAMVQIQRLTGMRPGEVVLMRRCDIDVENDIWIYRPPNHKNDWRGHARAVAIGPQGQAVLRSVWDRPHDAYLFSPRDAQLWRLEKRANTSSQSRKTPIYPSELKAREKRKRERSAQRMKRKPGDRYTTQSYAKALSYAFKLAEKHGVVVERWSPNQLRHSRATELRKRFGVEASRVTLGHARLDATEIYAEKDLELAVRVAAECG